MLRFLLGGILSFPLWGKIGIGTLYIWENTLLEEKPLVGTLIEWEKEEDLYQFSFSLPFLFYQEEKGKWKLFYKEEAIYYTLIRLFRIKYKAIEIGIERPKPLLYGNWKRGITQVEKKFPLEKSQIYLKIPYLYAFFRPYEKIGEVDLSFLPFPKERLYFLRHLKVDFASFWEEKETSLYMRILTGGYHSSFFSVGLLGEGSYSSLPYFFLGGGIWFRLGEIYFYPKGVYSPYLLSYPIRDFLIFRKEDPPLLKENLRFSLEVQVSSWRFFLDQDEKNIPVFSLYYESYINPFLFFYLGVAYKKEFLYYYAYLTQALGKYLKGIWQVFFREEERGFHLGILIHF